MPRRPWIELELTAAALVLALGVLAGFAAAGWPGEPNGCIRRATCFCEAFRDGWVRQPANTWSNLGFVAAGLCAAATPGLRRRGALRPPGDNPMATTSLYPGLYGLVVALLGPGSMALHASMTREGGRWDVLSMYVWIAFCLAYAARRALPLSTRGFAVLYAGLVAALAWSKWNASLSSDVVFGLLIAGFAAGEWAVWRRRPDRVQQRGWLGAAGAVFALAFALWLPSRRPDGALCDPGSLLQGHAAWHLLGAVSTLLIFQYYRSERAAPAAAREPDWPGAPAAP